MSCVPHAAIFLRASWLASSGYRKSSILNIVSSRRSVPCGASWARSHAVRVFSGDGADWATGFSLNLSHYRYQLHAESIEDVVQSCSEYTQRLRRGATK